MQGFNRLIFVLLAVAAASSAPASEPAAGGIEAKAAFERLKQLAGDWEGTVTTKDGPAAQVRYELVSNKTVVMETLFPGTDHEMRSVYHLDGGDLVMTHYCAMGNQPRMKLKASDSSPSHLVFDFTGGTNMDPAKDAHIHSGRIQLLDADHMEAEWAVYQGEKKAGANLFFMARKK